MIKRIDSMNQRQEMLEKSFGQSLESMNQMAVNQHRFRDDLKRSQEQLLSAIQEKQNLSRPEATNALEGQVTKLSQTMSQGQPGQE